MSTADVIFDALVVGGGPAGSTAAGALARRGYAVALLDRGGRVKPCGGAIPPRLLADHDVPDHLVVARATTASVFSPQGRRTDMPARNGYVGMVDRCDFDEWLRARAQTEGATRFAGHFEALARAPDGTMRVSCRTPVAQAGAPAGNEGRFTLAARAIVGADGALSAVARAAGVRGARGARTVFGYHEIIETPADLDRQSCEIHFDGALSPDFYAWVFPHGATTSVGIGAGRKGFSMRAATATLRARRGLAGARTIRREGAPIPIRALPRWDDGHAVVLAGDAAGVVAPASGEGIYYAMVGGMFAADAVARFLRTGRPAALRDARRRFMAEHGGTYLLLALMERFWYANDARRERFVRVCRDAEVQDMTWAAYLSKTAGGSSVGAKLRVAARNVFHLLGVTPG